MITVMMVSIILVITGLGLLTLGIVPGIDELMRIFIYLVISVVYISLWLGVAILFSIVFRSTATSALAALAVWIFFLICVPYGVNILSNALTPDTPDLNAEEIMQRAKIVKSFAIHGPLCRPPAPAAEYSDCRALYHLPDRHYHHMLCDILYRIHASGDTIALNICLSSGQFIGK
jgi:hypothetical protein